MQAVQVSELHRQLVQSLEETGEFYFEPKALMDAFGLAYERAHTQRAIDTILSFNKEMRKLRMQISHVGFVEVDRADARFAFAYTLTSTRYQNDPLNVREVFTLRTPLLALVNDTAELWLNAYARRPIQDILAVSNGK
jgi:hypothetical protein